MKKTFSVLAAGLLAVVLSACTLTITGETEPVTVRPAPALVASPTPTPAPGPVVLVPSYPLNESMTYLCTNARLVVRYTSNDSARVFYGEWIDLTRSVMDDGWFTYKNADYTWYARGNQGYLEQNGRTVRSNCTLT